jgi:hypothetical protein
VLGVAVNGPVCYFATVFHLVPSHEPNEPPHVHVDHDDLSAKFWLEPVGLAYNLGYSAHELRRIERIIHENQPKLREAWRGTHGT